MACNTWSNISVGKLLRAVHELSEDEPANDPRVWYRTQKEHWIGWLSEYSGPGAYGRLANATRDARFAYNHVVNPQMLLWLIDAAGVDKHLLSEAKHKSSAGTSMMQQSGIIRRIVPWETVATALWGGVADDSA